MSFNSFAQIPVINLSEFADSEKAKRRIAERIGKACREYGFFYIVGHGVSESLQNRLEDLSRRFFNLKFEQKNEIRMELGGRAWRGYFPLGGEMTSGKPDLKEGIYFGAEADDNHPAVKNKTPMFGKNLFPAKVPDLQSTVHQYLEEMERLGHLLMKAISLSLGLDEDYFAENYTADPLTLFRIFNYPPVFYSPAKFAESFGVGEHTDYGLLTILRQDFHGGLEIKIGQRWIAAPPLENSFVCNIGDMLDRVTKGLYLSTPHRVRNLSNKQRVSFAFFFDPNFESEVKPIDLPVELNETKETRWDSASVHEFSGKYGDYLLNKVSKVFPQLKHEVL